MCVISALLAEPWELPRQTLGWQELTADKGTCQLILNTSSALRIPSGRGQWTSENCLPTFTHAFAEINIRLSPLQKWATHLLVSVGNLHWWKECFVCSFCGTRVQSMLDNSSITKWFPQPRNGLQYNQPGITYWVFAHLMWTSTSTPGNHPLKCTQTHVPCRCKWEVSQDPPTRHGYQRISRPDLVSEARGSALGRASMEKAMFFPQYLFSVNLLSCTCIPYML